MTKPYRRLKEFSVVYTDRSLNHMSDEFIDVMKDISSILKEAYNADTAAIVPGSGTFGMEAVVRQFANRKKCLIIRNGWFSYRWSQIFDASQVSPDVVTVMARRHTAGDQEPFYPADLDMVVQMIQASRPDVVFAPHVETSAGMILPDDYLRAVGAATKEAGGIFVLDCIASGATWVDTKACNVDVLVTAPQKGWTSSPCAALIVMNSRARQIMEGTTSSSFAMDLKKWTQVMETFEKGSHLYSSTMPTDSLRLLRDTMIETRDAGFDNLKQRQAEMGLKVRELFESHGFRSVSAAGYQSPGVVVSYTTDPDIANTKKFVDLGLQVAAGVPLVCNEGDGFRTFRIGLLGLNKLQDIDSVIATLSDALERLPKS